MGKILNYKILGTALKSLIDACFKADEQQRNGETIAIIKGKKSLSDINEDELVRYAYKLALDLLKDKDGVYNIREYFLK